jgi:uncharacterized protein HemY
VTYDTRLVNELKQRFPGSRLQASSINGRIMLRRGDYKRAREKLAAAQRQDPANRYVQNNLQLLEDSYRTGKAIR